MVTRVNGGISPGGFGTATLKMFTVDPNADLTGEVGDAETALEAIVQTIQTKATTFIIGAVDASNGFRVACEPSAWTAADLQVAIRALGTVNSKDLSGATVADFTF
jgi:hypothetical protein